MQYVEGKLTKDVEKNWNKDDKVILLAKNNEGNFIVMNTKTTDTAVIGPQAIVWEDKLDLDVEKENGQVLQPNAASYSLD
jgi:hypothetical protein